eukprot:6188779-Pleurochrysis_carterae.AAC.2
MPGEASVRWRGKGAERKRSATNERAGEGAGMPGTPARVPSVCSTQRFRVRSLLCERLFEHRRICGKGCSSMRV